MAVSTHVHRVPEGSRHHWLVEVRSSNGVVLIAVGDGPFRESQPVRLAQRDDGAVIALHNEQDRS